MVYANRATRLRAQPPAGQLSEAFNDSVDVAETNTEHVYEITRASNPRFPGARPGSPPPEPRDEVTGMADDPGLRARAVRGVDPALRGKSRRYGR